MGSGLNPEELARQNFMQRTLALAKPASQGLDPLDPASIAAKQRAAGQMKEGLNQSFGTSTRGTDIPQGAGLKGPGGNAGAADAPIIGTMDGRNLPQSVDAAAAENAAEEERIRKLQDQQDLMAPPRGTYRN